MSDPSQIADSLWKAADQLRANSGLNALECSMPVLGLLFLRYATNRYEVVRTEIERTLPSRGGKKRALTSADFESRAAMFIPEIAHYDYLLALPESKDLGRALDEAMRAIESESALLKGVLPKDYAAFDRKVLCGLVQIFSREELRQAESDVFGGIYEHFLDRFAISGALERGEFRTPGSIAETIIRVVEPREGTVFDPACGSAGMLVQTGRYLKDLGIDASKRIVLYGQEASKISTQLAKMNLAVHGLDGNIHQGNTLYDSRLNLMGECDYVVANPPFNVDMVDLKKIRNDERLFTERKIPGVSAKTKTVSNANYLWIQYFYSYLKPGKGRAGFVMPNSASDAGRAEKAIREELIATGDVDAIISIGTNFFYTRSLPCTLWFFDRGKPANRKNKVLMIDAREIYRVVNRRFRDFSPEQIELILSVVWLYRGQTEKYQALIRSCFARTRSNSLSLRTHLSQLEGVERSFISILADVETRSRDSDYLLKPPVEKFTELKGVVAEMHNRRQELLSFFNTNANLLEPLGNLTDVRGPKDHYMKTVRQLVDRVFDLQRSFRFMLGALKETNNSARKIIEKAERTRERREYLEKLEIALKSTNERLERSLESIQIFLDSFQQLDKLSSYFPSGEFSNVTGFCRIVSREEILEQESSLNPARYVGTAPAQSVESRVIALLREGNIEDWNRLRERSRGGRPNLAGADLSNLYLRKADLSNAILNDAILDRSLLSEAILQGVEGRSASFKNADMRKVDLRESILTSANIKEANLAGANLHSADLRDAQIMKVNLKSANLSEARVLRTNFHGADLTGACIADWQIGDTTLLDDVRCGYIFRKLNLPDGAADDFQSRLPVDRNSTFKAGEFSQRFQIMQSASETIDLTFTEGINWEALLSALQKVRAENAGRDISIQRLEQKENAFVVSLAVDSEIDIESVDRSLNTHYNRMLQLLEHENKHLREANIQLLEVVKTMSERDRSQTINNNFQNPNIGNFANSVEGGQIGGTVNIYGAKMEDITQLIASLRSHAQTLPKEHQEATLDALKDLEADVSKPNPDTNKVARRLKGVVAAFTTAGMLAAGTAKFSGDVKSTIDNLSELLIEAPVELVLPESSPSSGVLPES